MTDLFLGIDIGGTKTGVCVGDAAGNILARQRQPTGDDAPENWLERTRAQAAETLRAAGITLDRIAAVGLSTPGPMSVRDGLMLTPPNMPRWVNVPVRDWFARHFQKPVFINNDAKSAALAEFIFGRHKGTPDMVYLTLSTGVGGGVISGGRLAQGTNDLAGEVGHHVLAADGPPCPCGQRGCFEIYCGGRNVALRLQDALRAGAASRLRDLCGGDLAKVDFRLFAQAVRAGDDLALRYWEEFLERLAQALGTVMMFYNPSVLLLGTIATALGDFLLTPLRARVPRYAWAPAVAACRIESATLGEALGELGALAVAVTSVCDRP